MPCLPVDSASSCSTQSPKRAGLGKADLVAALAPALAEREAELEAGVALVEAAGLGHLAAPGRADAATSTPISAAGTSPNGERAE